MYKDFSDNSTASVSLNARCSSGTVTNNPQTAREGVPAVFNVTGEVVGTTCTVSEPTVPTGYTRNQTDCQNGDPLGVSCTIVNTLNTTSGTFTVYKDFSDNNAASVSVTASCSSGTVTNNPQSAREGVPAVFTITGALAGATCTASEPTVPTGYTKNESDCQNGYPLNGSCMIVNTPDATRGGETIASSGFEPGQAEGWRLKRNTPADWRGYAAENGDVHDLTFIRPRNSVLLLSAKGPARKDTSGFVVTID